MILINHSLIALWFLIYWPDEEALSIVKESNVVSSKESLVKGQWCKIKEGRKMYDGKIVEIGKLCCVCIVAVAVVIIIIVLFLFVHVCITVESFSVNCLYM